MAHFHRRLLLVSRSVPISEFQLRNQKRAPGCSGFTVDYISQLYWDYFIHHETRIPIKQNKQPGFNGVCPARCFFNVLRIRDSLEKRRGVSNRGHLDLCFCCEKNAKTIPIPSMHGIFTYIWLIFMTNGGIYQPHGWYGIQL